MLPLGGVVSRADQIVNKMLEVKSSEGEELRTRAAYSTLEPCDDSQGMEAMSWNERRLSPGESWLLSDQEEEGVHSGRGQGDGLFPTDKLQRKMRGGGEVGKKRAARQWNVEDQ